MPHGRVLRVDGHDLAAADGARFGDHRTRRDEALFVREREALAGFQRRQRRGEAGEADHRVEDDIDFGERGELGERVGIVGTGARELGCDAELDPLAFEERGVAPGGQRHDPEVVAVPVEDVERLGPDGSGRSEDRDADGHAAQVRRSGPARGPPS